MRDSIEVNGRTIPWLTLGGLVEAKAAQHGDAVFADIDGTPLTHADLERRSRAIAYALLGLGLGRGDRVSTFMLNAVEQILVWFGTVRAGLVWVPLNAGLVDEDLRYTLSNSGARVLVVDDECLPKFVAVRERLQPMRAYLTRGATDLPDIASFASFEASGAPCALPETHPRDTGAILYTGGTTGLPKGVVLPQLSFILSGVRYAESFAVEAGERMYSTMPLFHAGALQWGIMGPLVNDMTTVVDRKFSASRYFDRVREIGANVIDPMGVVLTMLCLQPPGDSDRDHQVRVAVGATHGLPAEIPTEFTRRFGIPLVMVYGITEGGGSLLTTNRDFVGDSNGRAHGWIDVRIVDDDGLPLPVGVQGRIVLRPNVPHMFMTEYFADPGRTGEVYRDCWLHTGDLGRMDEHGNLTFIGREAHFLRRRGENISAVEVETLLAACPGVREVAVVAAPSELGEDEVKAFVVPEPGADAAEIGAWCMGRMAPFKMPRFVEFIDALPRSTAKMEIDRSALRRREHRPDWDRVRANPRRPT